MSMESASQATMRRDTEVHRWTYHQALFNTRKPRKRACVYREAEYDPGSDSEI